MKRYVVGFLFSNDGDMVALIQKTKPAWQYGRLNGVGGKVEPTDMVSPHGWTVKGSADAAYLTAMIREWREETGDLSEINWQRFATLSSAVVYDDAHDQDWWEIAYFAATGDVSKPQTQPPTEGEAPEEIRVWERFMERVLDNNDDPIWMDPTPRPLPNLAWLLPMAWNRLTDADKVVFEIREVSAC